MDLKDSLAITAMWFAGFNTFQPVNICRGGPEFLLKRYGFPLSAVGMFVGETSSSVNFFVVVGTLAGLFLSTVSKWVDSAWSKYITPVLSLFSSTVIVLINCRILCVYRTCEGCDGIRKMFYWLSMAGLAYGFDMPVTWNVSPDKSTHWSLGENIANGFLLFLHWILRVLLKSPCIGVIDVDYHIMLGHITIVLFISIVTLGLWVIHVFFNVLYGDTDKSDFGDAIQWLLSLKQTAEHGGGVNGQTHSKWSRYLGDNGECSQSGSCQEGDCIQRGNFATYFDKLCGLNRALTALECTTATPGQLNGGTPNLTNSMYQLRSHMEKLQQPLEKLKGITDKITATSLAVRVTMQNGGSGDSKSCCTGSLRVTKQLTINISGIKGTFQNCIRSATISEAIKLCASVDTIVAFKYGDDVAGKTVSVIVASGELSLKPGDNTCTVSALTCTFFDETNDVTKLTSIAIVGLKGSKEGCDVTNLKIGIFLDINQEQWTIKEACDSETVSARATQTVALKSTSFITIGGIVKNVEAVACLDVGGRQVCAGFGLSLCAKETKNRFDFGFFYSYEVGPKPTGTNVEVVSLTVNVLTRDKMVNKITATVGPAVLITECSATTGITNDTVKIQKISPIDQDQKNNYRHIRDELTKLYPKKKGNIARKLEDDGVTDEINDATYCSTSSTIAISASVKNVCMYLVHNLKSSLNTLTNKDESKAEAMKTFVEYKTDDVQKGFLNAALNGLSPFMMVILAVAFIFMIYPGISPYLMVAEEWQYISSLILLFISSLGPFIPWTLCLDKVKPWAKYDTLWVEESYFYHYFWVLAAPIILIYITCLVSLHYPQSWSSRNIRYHCPAIFMCYTYHTCVFVLRAMGSSAMYSNGAGIKPEKKLSESGSAQSNELFLYEFDPENGNIIATAGVSLSMCVMVAVGFVTQAYVSSYRSFVESEKSGGKWPTDDKNWLSAYFWWFGMSVPKAYTRFKNIRDMDIVTALG